MDWYAVGKSLVWTPEQKVELEAMRPGAPELADWYRGVLQGQANRIGPVRARPDIGSLLDSVNGKKP